MIDEYAYLRSQYEAIIEHTSYLLRNCPDRDTLNRAYESRQRAQHDLARLADTCPTNT